MSATSQIVLQRHPSVEGSAACSNDVIFIGKQSEASKNVIFFGGDVQDYPELMSKHRDNHRFLDWNLETTGQLLNDRFSSVKDDSQPHHIWIVRPSRIVLGTFSYYDNFVSFDDDGLPSFPCLDSGSDTSEKDSCRALSHLELLLTSSCARQNQLFSSAQDGSLCSWLGKPLILVGFSRGCIVLNQIVTELSRASKMTSFQPLLKSLTDFYWLDSGHNGQSMIWPCNENLLKEAFISSELHIRCHLYATPYQVEDPMRRWNGKEFRKMCSALLKVGVRYCAGVLLAMEEPSLLNHFNILKCFPIKNSD